MKVVAEASRNDFVVVTLEEDGANAIQNLVSPTAKKAVLDHAKTKGYMGSYSQHSNPYFVDKKGAMIDTEPDPSKRRAYNPSLGDKVRIEYRVYNQASRK